MSHYWKKCPHCGRVVEEGYGSAKMELGNPSKICKHCWGRYTDSHVIDWKSASGFKKFLFYIGNGRLLLSGVSSLIMYAYLRNWADMNHGPSLAISIATGILIFFLCALYVRHLTKGYSSSGIRSHKKVEKIMKKEAADRYEKYKNGLFEATDDKTKKK